MITTTSLPNNTSGPSPALPAAGSSSNPSSSSSSAAPAADPLANENTFLKLLVAQLQNQSPLDPSDPMQFVTQLAQFSSVEQLLGMRQDIAAIRQDLDKSTGATTPVPGN